MNQGWKKVELKDACLIRPPKNEVYSILNETELVSFAPMSDLGINEKYFSPIEEKELKSVYSGYTYFRDNDVILAKITPCFENGKLGIATNLKNGIGFGSSEFVVYRTKEFLLKEFLYYFLNQPYLREIGKKRMTGAVGHKRIPKIFYEEYKIPIPLLDEQKRIVVKLDKCFEAIDKARANVEKNLNNSKELFQSQLNQIFSQKGDGLVVKKIEEISRVINGFSFKSGDFLPTNHVKSIKITNVGVKEFVEESDNLLPKNFSTLYKDVLISSGDIVLALTRTIIADGLKVAIVPESYHCALLNQRVASIVCDKTKTSAMYLYYYLCTETVTKYVLSNVNTLMQPNLSIKDLKNMPVPMFSLEIQGQIVKKLDGLKSKTQSLESNYQQELDALDELKKSILQKAFNGEL